MNKWDNEKKFLEKVYTTHVKRDSKQTKVIRELTYRTIEPYLKKEQSVLELGCSDGYMTEMLAKKVKHLDVVDGSKFFFNKATADFKKKEITNVEFYLSLFETFETNKKYDLVIASFILEHVLDPQKVLEVIYNILKEEGLLIVVVPNANALSRQLALQMNLYKSLKELTEHDHKVGHRRVYDTTDLNNELIKANFATIEKGGIMLKFLADFQLDQLYKHKILKEEQIEGLFKLGKLYPDLCGGIYSVCKKII